jgi:TetR/AcrR family transcriptional regulator, tetracycline repressor protein
MSNRYRDLAAIWAQPPPKRPALTREHIAREALALLDEVGFEGLTMRRLAERLGVRAASLYKHVRDKHELLTLLADAMGGEARWYPPDPTQSWREQVEQGAWGYRRILLAHRDAARILIATPPIGPKRLEAIEQWLKLLRAGGLSDRDVADVASIFNTFIVGFVLDETQSFPTSDRPDIPESELRAQVERFFKSLPFERFPTVVDLADELVNGDMDRRFGLAVQLLLDGLERRLG